MNAMRTDAAADRLGICTMRGSVGALGHADDLMVTKMQPEFLWGRQVTAPLLDRSLAALKGTFCT